MKIFVTGGSGFVGGHVIERLAKQHEVRALARSAGSAATVKGFGATPVLGDLDTLNTAMVGDAEVVVHAAAYVKSYGPREAFEAANIGGTHRALEAARGAGVRRFVHIGTEAMLFDGHDLVDVNERTAPPVKHRFLYSETKAEAERLVLAANGDGFATLSLRPRLVWGPRDGAVLPEVLEAARRGAFAWIDGGHQRTSTAYVENLSAAVELALTRGRGGEAYFIADDGERPMRDFLSALAQSRGVNLPDRSVPGSIARPIARAVEGLWSLFAPNAKPPMVAFAIAMMSRTVTVNIDKARKELGYVPEVSFEEALRRTTAAG
jgi:nucleoside-diphosphate-sugar epimerase